jgi:hypothetical protein
MQDVDLRTPLHVKTDELNQRFVDILVRLELLGWW